MTHKKYHNYNIIIDNSWILNVACNECNHKKGNLFIYSNRYYLKKKCVGITRKSIKK